MQRAVDDTFKSGPAGSSISQLITNASEPENWNEILYFIPAILMST